jgi:hypothetical protein
MHIIKKNIFLTLLALIWLPISGCSTSQIIDKENYQFRKTTTYTASLSQLQRSTTTIDRGKTRQLFFIITKREKCIKLFLKSQHVSSKKNTPLMTYYIVEKVLDTNVFRNAPQYTFSKLYQNYDDNWRTKQEGFICSQQTDPIRQLKPGIYRILLTTFQSTDAKLQLTIFSDNKVKVATRLPSRTELENIIQKSFLTE